MMLLCKKGVVNMLKKELIKAEEIVKGSEYAVLALVDEKGFPRASAISNIKTSGLKEMWFATGISTGKVRCIKHSNKAGLCYCNIDDNVTLMGEIEILTDEKSRKEFWQEWFIRHFPGGIDDPEYCILHFTAEKAVLWVNNIYEEIEL